MLRWLILSACLGLAPVISAGMPSMASSPAPAPMKLGEPGAGGMYAYLTRDGQQQKVPLFAPESGKLAVAKVGDDSVLLADLVDTLAELHGDLGAGAVAGAKDFKPVLDRMIDARLLAAEAREMGIDELPEVKAQVAEFRTATARQMLQAKALAGVKADPAEVKRIYRDAVREWKVRSILFAGELDAKNAAPQLRAKGAFDKVAKQLVADKKAKGSGEPGWLPRSQMLPQVQANLDKLKAGQVSPPVKVQEGYAVMKVEEIRYPENPQARAEAERIALQLAQKRALQKYYDGLVKRWAKVDRALLDSLDFHAEKPGLEALKKDPRVLASFEGEKPITVGDLSNAVAEGFFHGVDRAIKEKKINKQKLDVFDGLLAQRAIPLEVRAEGIDKSPELDRRVAQYENGLLFAKFVEKAIVPKLDVGDAKVKKYYEQHRKEYMYPTFYKVESLAFATVKDAEGAIKQLRGGTDYKWLGANADGQIPPEKRKLGIEGTLAATALPADVAATLAGAKKGDYRLHASPESQFYAIHVVDVIGAKEQPFEEVKEGIAKKLFNDELVASVRKWSDTIRNARPVQVFLTKIGS